MKKVHLPVVSGSAVNYETKTQAYSTWGGKLLQHIDVLHAIQKNRHFSPITVQMGPTENCSSSCPFCSVDRRPRDQKIAWPDIVQGLTEFRDLGAKALELTGAGDPLLYRDGTHNINDVISLALDLGYEVGVITDTEVLGRHMSPAVAAHLSWVRVSMIKLDEGKTPEDYDFTVMPEGKVGISYIVYDGTTVESIEKLARVVELNPSIKFVRVAADCLGDDALTIKGKWGPIIQALDKHDKFFIKEINAGYKAFEGGCWVGMLRPYWTSFGVMICTSHVLINRTYHDTWKLCGHREIKTTWDKMNARFKAGLPPYEIDIKGECKNCYYHNNNSLLSGVIQTLPDKNFA